MDLPVPQDYHNTRLDRFLRKQFSQTTLSSIFRLIRKGIIRVNGKRKKPDYRLRSGDIVRVPFGESDLKEIKLIKLSDDVLREVANWIVFENEELLLCNKPPGLVMHKGSKHPHGMVEMVRAFTGNSAITFVNRIDKETSGLVVAAKNLQSAQKLAEIFRSHAVEKYYAVVVEGLVWQNTFTLSSYLVKEEDGVRETLKTCEGAKKALSFFTVQERRKETTLLEARLHTGRTHQLRVQLAAMGHPIVGDAKYGKAGGRMMLFSRRIVIESLNIDQQLPLPESF